ncbi:AraC family transcriptional regulator, regulatory protein of adaptative response / methylphosphotriester-DNA alkyltransferase methyltransferase [Paenibacillaceae bacterium GAS479]|nr:AraC family transcriptional regulator, regulatory protein of adaptative response / methylphosphotriester-DNA alkyltransferase methyltransferase [Paenibacillaceae bacterium GAS479]
MSMMRSISEEAVAWGAPTDEQWRAVCNCDNEADGSFWYAVKTTGIFCRPSCKSRTPKRDHTAVFGSPSEALKAGFRACKRCQPDAAMQPSEAWIDGLIRYIRVHLQEDLSLAALAEVGCSSPWHLHRSFKRQTGLTPQQFVRRERMRLATELLSRSDAPVADIGRQVAMPGAAHFIAMFRRELGCTPAEYRKQIKAIQAGKEKIADE